MSTTYIQLTPQELQAAIQAAARAAAQEATAGILRATAVSWNLKQAAAALDISTPTARARERSGKLPPRHAGRFDAAEVLAACAAPKKAHKL